jgi:hypothetical protein
LTFVLAACRGNPPEPASTPGVNPPTPEGEEIRLPTPTPFSPIIAPQVRGPSEPVRLPDYFASIPFDGIFPVYDPQFVNAADAPLSPDELVLGAAMGGQAKAYPVTVLRFREIVNDELAGIPILVTW